MLHAPCSTLHVSQGVYPGPRSGIAAASTRGRGLLFGGCTDQPATSNKAKSKTATEDKEQDDEQQEEDDEQVRTWVDGWHERGAYSRCASAWLIRMRCVLFLCSMCDV